MRLIDADELIYFTVDESDPPFSFVPKEFIDEADELVTCKECLFCYLKDGHTGTCDNRWGMNGTVKPGDYCSRGKRKNEDRADRCGRTQLP